MKRALIVCFAVMTSVVAMCQDVIVTMDAKKIEAKILEVSKTEIKYKEQDNLEGPTFVLGVEEISSVIYANGKVVLYNQPEQPKTNVAASPVSKPKEPVKAVPQEIPGRIYKDKGKYRYNGTYIDSKEVARILQRENTFAYDQWKKGKGMLIGGKDHTGIHDCMKMWQKLHNRYFYGNDTGYEPQQTNSINWDMMKEVFYASLTPELAKLKNE